MAHMTRKRQEGVAPRSLSGVNGKQGNLKRLHNITFVAICKKSMGYHVTVIVQSTRFVGDKSATHW